jgi:hypothetical protein
MSATAVEKITHEPNEPRGPVRLVPSPKKRHLLRWSLFVLIACGIVLTVLLGVVLPANHTIHSHRQMTDTAKVYHRVDHKPVSSEGYRARLRCLRCGGGKEADQISELTASVCI